MTPEQYKTNVIEPARKKADEACNTLLKALREYVATHPLSVALPGSVQTVIEHLRDGGRDMHDPNIPCLPRNHLSPLEIDAVEACRELAHAENRLKLFGDD